MPVGSTGSATRGLYPGSSLEPLAHRVQPAGPGAGALQPPGGPRIAIARQAGGHPPGGVELTPDDDVEIGGGSPPGPQLVAHRPALGDRGPGPLPPPGGGDATV